MCEIFQPIAVIYCFNMTTFELMIVNNSLALS